MKKLTIVTTVSLTLIFSLIVTPNIGIQEKYVSKVNHIRVMIDDPGH